MPLWSYCVDSLGSSGLAHPDRGTPHAILSNRCVSEGIVLSPFIRVPPYFLLCAYHPYSLFLSAYHPYGVVSSRYEDHLNIHERYSFTGNVEAQQSGGRHIFDDNLARVCMVLSP